MSVHLILNGLLGAILGFAAFPAICVALLLQAVLFQYGGLTVLGVNTLDMALPAVVCYLAFRPFLGAGGWVRSVGAFCCGFLAVLLAGGLTALALALSGEAFFATAKVILVAHGPQQDPGRAALQRVQGAFSPECRGIFRQLLRLLPAGGLPSPHGYLH